MLSWVVNYRPHPRPTSPSSLPCSHSHFGTHPSVIKKKSPFLFMHLRNANFATPLFCYSYKMPGGVSPSIRTFRPPTVSTCFRPIPFFSYLCALFCSFLLAPKTQLFCFQAIPHSLSKKKHPGGGRRFNYPRRKNRGTIPFHSFAQGGLQEL